MSMIRAALALAGAALLAGRPADAQTASSPALALCGRNDAHLRNASRSRFSRQRADWTQEQINAQPQGEQTRDREAYKRQVTALYQQHLGVYTGQAQKFASDKQLLEQFKAGFQGAKLAVAQEASHEIANGVEPVDRNNGVATLTNPERPVALEQHAGGTRKPRSRNAGDRRRGRSRGHDAELRDVGGRPTDPESHQQRPLTPRVEKTSAEIGLGISATPSTIG
ncbi:MAG: hypothetical protein WDO24_14640 [Pseudomonadota bacterium]